MGFWNNLILGRTYEEKVATWFESQNFSVWRLGNFRLPFDLWVWNEFTEFSVEVKYRTIIKKTWTPYMDRLNSISQGILLRHFFFLFYPKGLSITSWDKLPYSRLTPLGNTSVQAWKRLQFFNITSQDIFSLYIKGDTNEVLSAQK